MAYSGSCTCKHDFVPSFRPSRAAGGYICCVCKGLRISSLDMPKNYRLTDGSDQGNVREPLNINTIDEMGFPEACIDFHIYAH